MFTGIITDKGTVRAIVSNGDKRFELTTGYDTDDIVIGESISCSGACLTVVETGPDWFAATVSAETLAKTTLGDWRVGTEVNLERSLRLGDSMGGHIVTGHVDGTGRLIAAEAEGDSMRLTFEAPSGFARSIAPKGSIAIDGVSLTVNDVDGRRFGVNIIPHTLEATSLGSIRPEDLVNLEIDVIARYVARLLEKD